MNGKKVLLIDDDPDFLQMTVLYFKKAGLQVITARNGMEGISKAQSYQPDLIILDIMMPGINGFKICRKIRKFSLTPIIITTALTQENDMLQGLEAGADGFLSKPFNWEVLLARARAVMRRGIPGNTQNGTYDYNDGYLKLDFDKHRVLVDEHQIRLTPVEFRLLVYLVRNAERVLSFDEILVNVWGNQYQGNKDYVHVYVSHLRKKIEADNKDPCYILSIHGVGYMFERQELEWAAPEAIEKIPVNVSQGIDYYQH